MKLTQLQEARYYGRHTRHDVIKQYQKATTDRENYFDSTWSGGNIQLRSMETSGKYLWGDIFVKDASGPKEDVGKEIEQYLNKMNVPFDEVYDITPLQNPQHEFSTEEWEATTVLNLEPYPDKINEAKYAGRYDLKTVRALYKRAAQDPDSPVYFHSVHINAEANYVLARFNVIAGAPENEVRQQIKHWHDINEIPFDEIASLTELDDDWSVFVKYKGPKRSRRHSETLQALSLHEARYYQKIPATEVLKQYKEMMATRHPGQNEYMDTCSIHSVLGGKNNHAIADVGVYDARNDIEATRKAVAFMQQHDLPFNEVEESDVQGSEEQGWSVIMSYTEGREMNWNQDNRVNEARYAQENPTAEEVYKLYKSVEKRFDYTWGENSRAEREDELGQPYSLSYPIGIEAIKRDHWNDGGSYVELDLLFHWDMPRDVGEKWTHRFAADNNLPYNDIDVDYHDRQNTATWATIIQYDPKKFNK